MHKCNSLPCATCTQAYANHAVDRRACAPRDDYILTLRAVALGRLRDLSKETTLITINDDRMRVNAGVYPPGMPARHLKGPRSVSCLAALAVARIMTAICIRLSSPLYNIICMFRRVSSLIMHDVVITRALARLVTLLVRDTPET